jgi:hypothetical protein
MDLQTSPVAVLDLVPEAHISQATPRIVRYVVHTVLHPSVSLGSTRPVP